MGENVRSVSRVSRHHFGGTSMISARPGPQGPDVHQHLEWEDWSGSQELNLNGSGRQPVRPYDHVGCGRDPLWTRSTRLPEKKATQPLRAVGPNDLCGQLPGFPRKSVSHRTRPRKPQSSYAQTSPLSGAGQQESYGATGGATGGVIASSAASLSVMV